MVQWLIWSLCSLIPTSGPSQEQAVSVEYSSPFSWMSHKFYWQMGILYILLWDSILPFPDLLLLLLFFPFPFFFLSFTKIIVFVVLTLLYMFISLFFIGCIHHNFHLYHLLIVDDLSYLYLNTITNSFSSFSKGLLCVGACFFCSVLDLIYCYVGVKVREKGLWAFLRSFPGRVVVLPSHSAF